MLIDRFMPHWDERTHHERRIEAPVDEVWDALWSIDIGRIGVIRALFALRGLPGWLLRKAPKRPAEPTPTLVAIQSVGFGKLAEEPWREVVFGVNGRFWSPASNIDPFVREEFESDVPKGRTRAVWSFQLEPDGDGATNARTETRIAAGDRASRIKFRAYWLLVRPFSGWIRVLMLREIARWSESGAPSGPLDPPPTP